MPWNHYDISQDSKDILNVVREKANRINGLKGDILFWSICFFSCTFLFLFSFYKIVIVGSDGQVALMLRKITSNYLVFITIAGTIISYTRFIKMIKLKESEQIALEKIRGKTIGRLKADWVKNNKSDLRDQITKDMKEQCGVNVNY